MGDMRGTKCPLSPAAALWSWGWGRVLMDLESQPPVSSRGADVVKSENSDLINFCFIFTF